VGGAFQPLHSVNYYPTASADEGSSILTLTDNTGLLGTGVDAIRITIFATDNGAGESAVFREIDIVGSATQLPVALPIPEPNTLLLAVCGLWGLRFQRRRGLAS